MWSTVKPQPGAGIAHDILRMLAAQGPRTCVFESADVHALAGALDDVIEGITLKRASHR
jgi:hypothetical protein